MKISPTKTVLVNIAHEELHASLSYMLTTQLVMVHSAHMQSTLKKTLITTVILEPSANGNNALSLLYTKCFCKFVPVKFPVMYTWHMCDHLPGSFSCKSLKCLASTSSPMSLRCTKQRQAALVLRDVSACCMMFTCSASPNPGLSEKLTCHPSGTFFLFRLSTGMWV